MKYELYLYYSQLNMCILNRSSFIPKCNVYTLFFHMFYYKSFQTYRKLKIITQYIYHIHTTSSIMVRFWCFLYDPPIILQINIYIYISSIIIFLCISHTLFPCTLECIHKIAMFWGAKCTCSNMHKK